LPVSLPRPLLVAAGASKGVFGVVPVESRVTVKALGRAAEGFAAVDPYQQMRTTGAREARGSGRGGFERGVLLAPFSAMDCPPTLRARDFALVDSGDDFENILAAGVQSPADLQQQLFVVDTALLRGVKPADVG
jgi:hypothetical protein